MRVQTEEGATIHGQYPSLKATYTGKVWDVMSSIGLSSKSNGEVSKLSVLLEEGSNHVRHVSSNTSVINSVVLGGG